MLKKATFLGCLAMSLLSHAALSQDYDAILEQMRKQSSKHDHLELSWSTEHFVNMKIRNRRAAENPNPFGTDEESEDGDLKATAGGNSIWIIENSMRLRIAEPVKHRGKLQLFWTDMSLGDKISRRRMDELGQAWINRGVEFLECHDPGFEAIMLNYRPSNSQLFVELIEREASIQTAQMIWAGCKAISVQRSPRSTYYFADAERHAFLGYEQSVPELDEVRQLKVYVDEDSNQDRRQIRSSRYSVSKTNGDTVATRVYRDFQYNFDSKKTASDALVNFPAGFLVSAPREGGKKNISWIVRDDGLLEILDENNRDKLDTRVSRVR